MSYNCHQSTNCPCIRCQKLDQHNVICASAFVPLSKLNVTTLDVIMLTSKDVTVLALLLALTAPASTVTCNNTSALIVCHQMAIPLNLPRPSAPQCTMLWRSYSQATSATGSGRTHPCHHHEPPPNHTRQPAPSRRQPACQQSSTSQSR